MAALALPGAVIIGERCPSCSQFRSPQDMLRFANGNVSMCLRCYEKHSQALEVLAGAPPKGCGECGVTFEDLAARTLGDEVSMAVHIKDGIYQLLCSACDRVYVEKRRDLYALTPFGKERGL